MKGFAAWLWKPSSGLSAWGRAVRAPFSIPAFFYGLIMRVRQKFFDTGILKKGRLGVPVLVVGNLSVGGTGKTPLAAWIAKRLLTAGKRPVLISRGYTGALEGRVMVVSDGSELLLSAHEAGEEPLLLSEKLKGGVPVVMGRDRLKAGQFAIERFKPDCLVLDDGFQHLALERDVDVVLLDAALPPWEDRLLPRGRLREPPSALSRADVVVVGRAGKENPEQAGPLWKWSPSALVFFMRYLPEPLPGKGKRALAFCGIGSPEYFFELCEGQGVELVDRIEFPDHHRYGEGDIGRIDRRARELNADLLVTTEKDEIKLRGMKGFSLPLEVLKIEPEFFGKDEEFFGTVSKILFD